MRHFVIGLDSPDRPSKSALVFGPETDDDQVRKDFYEAKESGEHPNGWPILLLYGERGVQDVAHQRQTGKEQDQEHDEETGKESRKEAHREKGAHAGKHSAK